MITATSYHSKVERLAKYAALTILAICCQAFTLGAFADTQALPNDIAKMDDKLIKYKHSKNKRASNGRRYDIKVQYGRAWTHAGRSEPRRSYVTAFTRILISPAGKDDYRKPSADRLSELFPGSFVYTSLNASIFDPRGGNFLGACRKKSWHKSSNFTTFVKMRKVICSSRGVDSGHRARVGKEMMVDGKVK